MLQVNDIFETISGEAGGFLQGTWITGIRLQDCNLRCSYCDTPQAQYGRNGNFKKMSIHEVLREVRNKHVLITGGEPLLQEQTVHLIDNLLDAKHVVQVETNGSRELPVCLGKVQWVVDRKGPSSDMRGAMLRLTALYTNIERVRANGADVHLKWVIAENEDLDHAITEIQALSCLKFFGNLILSPVDANGKMIMEMADRLRREVPDVLDRVVFSVQLHKLFDLP